MHINRFDDEAVPHVLAKKIRNARRAVSGDDALLATIE
jgi:hypothetical protein